MTDSYEALLKWLYSTLSGDATLAAKATITSDPDPDGGFPQVVIGDATSEPWRTFDNAGEQFSLTVRVVVKEQSWINLASIQSDIQRLLGDVTEPFTIGDSNEWTVTAVDFDSALSIREPGEQFRKEKVLVYRALVSES